MLIQKVSIMKKLNNIIKSMRKYWYLSLIVIPIYFIAKKNHYLDNDTWFILNIGRYIFNNGFMKIDPFTIHDNLNFIPQQWLVDCIFWFIYNKFSSNGIFAIVMFLSVLLYYLIYKLFYVSNNNKMISFFLATITMILCSVSIVSRPQIFTFNILICETYLIEKYISTKNKKCLYGLPLLSLLLINLHATMWWFQFIFILPFIVNGIYIKNVTIDKYDVKPLLLILIPMFLVGLINPYGIDMITYLFRAYGYSELTTLIKEMGRLKYDGGLKSKYVIASIITLISSINFFKKRKLDIRHICFFFGTFILLILHVKSYPYFLFYSMYCFAYFYKDINLKKSKKILSNKYIKTLYNIIAYSMIGIGFSCSISIMVYGTLQAKLEYGFPDIGDYLINNYDSNNLIVYTDFDTGQYIEYLGYKTYIDGRAELFYKKFNGKEDIMIDYVKISANYSEFDYNAFLEKYNFDIVIVNVDMEWLFDKYLEESDTYKLVYSSLINNGIGSYNIYEKVIKLE